MREGSSSYKFKSQADNKDPLDQHNKMTNDALIQGKSYLNDDFGYE